MSTGLSILGLFVIFIAIDNIFITFSQPTLVALFSSIPMVIVWAGYFYLIQVYSVHEVVPLFGLSSIFLLIIELIGGETIGLSECGGIFVLIAGAYLLDRGAFKWGIPSRLLISMIPVSLSWAIAVYMMRFASFTISPTLVYFWQLIGITVIGLILFLFCNAYRNGFINRIKNEKVKFITHSVLNEGCAQISFWTGAIAFSLAPMAVFVTAMGGIQSIFLLLLFYLFPLETRNTITKAQWAGIITIALGIFLLELHKI